MLNKHKSKHPAIMIVVGVYWYKLKALMNVVCVINTF